MPQFTTFPMRGMRPCHAGKRKSEPALAPSLGHLIFQYPFWGDLRNRRKTKRQRERQNLLVVRRKTGWKVEGADGAAELLAGVKPTLAFTHEADGAETTRLKSGGGSSSQSSGLSEAHGVRSHAAESPRGGGKSPGRNPPRSPRPSSDNNWSGSRAGERGRCGSGAQSKEYEAG